MLYLACGRTFPMQKNDLSKNASSPSPHCTIQINASTPSEHSEESSEFSEISIPPEPSLEESIFSLSPIKKLTFNRVKKILSIADETVQNLGITVQNSPDKGKPNHFFGYTCEGLKLFCTPYPHSLATPWGAVSICGTIPEKDHELFKKRLLQRVCITTWLQAVGNAVTPEWLAKKLLPNIPERKSRFIDEGHPILTVDGKSCPPVAEMPKRAPLDWDTIADEWDNLEKAHRKHLSALSDFGLL